MRAFSHFPAHNLRQQGSALLLSLWALLVLSVAVFALAQYIHKEIGLTEEANLALDARALAYSGMMVALQPQVTLRTPALIADFGPNRGYRVRMVSEAGRLDINWLLQNPVGIEILKKYLTNRGINFLDVQRMVDCMIDWIDNDGPKTQPTGAEADEDYHPSNKPFQSLDEVIKVKGTGPLLALPNWQQDFTVLQTNGIIDLQSASIPVMASIPGASDSIIRTIVQLRQGLDKIDGTIDDQRLDETLVLGFFRGSLAYQNLKVYNPGQGLVRIISVGRSGKVSRQIEAVAQSTGAPGANSNTRNGIRTKFLLWKEN